MNTTLTPFETLNTENIRFADTFEGTYKTIIPIEDIMNNIHPTRFIVIFFIFFLP